MEIPSTPTSLLGGGKRIFTSGSTSQYARHDVRTERELSIEIADKKLLIKDLKEDLEHESDEGQRALTTEALDQARADLADLCRRLRVSREQNRRVNG